jgi:hypothetical protein
MNYYHHHHHHHHHGRRRHFLKCKCCSSDCYQFSPLPRRCNPLSLLAISDWLSLFGLLYAFHIFSHDLLLYKLNNYVISSGYFELFLNYLANSLVYVFLVYFRVLLSLSGVRYGSCLGPSIINIFIYDVLHIVQTGSGVHPTSYKMGTGALSRGLSGRGVKLTTHLQLVPRSRKCGSIHPLPHTSSWRNA